MPFPQRSHVRLAMRFSVTRPAVEFLTKSKRVEKLTGRCAGIGSNPRLDGYRLAGYYHVVD